MSSSAPAIGIDLGTTYSCAAVFRNGKVEIIPNAEGDRLTPSMVAFGSERLVGEAAKDQFMLEPRNTIYDVKRLIGSRFKDEVVQKDIKQWSFKVVDENGLPAISVQHKGKEKTYRPEEISAMLLERMKDAASTYLGCEVRDAVVTVPAYFSSSQRQATKDAATIAGLNVLRIINEPTAGALAYGLGDTDGDERNVLIFDFGGGTFDVTILKIVEQNFTVLSTTGDTHLGGSDVDTLLVEHFRNEFEQLHDRTLRDSPTALLRLRKACKYVKHTLSLADKANVDLDALLPGIDFNIELTRARFDELCADLFNATLEPVRTALKDANLEKSEIDDIVLVGGSTRIPAVQKMLRDFFDGKEIKQTVNPDEVVASGAAIQAAKLSDDPSEMIKDLVLVDVTPLSLGINSKGGVMAKLIEKNTTIPCEGTAIFTTAVDNQMHVLVEVFEGERVMTADNNLLGRFTMSGIPPGPAGMPRIQVKLNVNENGILEVSAVEKSTKMTSKITIANPEERLSKREIDRMIKEAEELKQEDQIRLEIARARNTLENYCFKVKAEVNKLKNKISTKDKDIVVQKCTETIDWIENTPNATKADCESKLKELQDVCHPISENFL